MIVSALLGIILMLLNLVVSLIPNFEVSYDIVSYITPLANFFGYIDSFVSVNVILMCITLVILVDNYALVFRVINWLWQKIPFIN